VLLQIVAPTEQETVLMTRSPGVNSAAAICGAANKPKIAADDSRALRDDGRMFGMTAPRLHLCNYRWGASAINASFMTIDRPACVNFCLWRRIYDD
jgi:hypothetical protein